MKLMRTVEFRIKDYLRPNDATHVARKELSRHWPVSAHTHDYFEVFLIERGSTEHWINGRRETLKAGDLVFVRPKDAHAFCADQRTGCHISNIMFRRSTAAHLCQRYPEEFGGRFFDRSAPFPETHQLRGPRLETAIGAAQELHQAKRTLARVEEFLLTMVNRIIEPVAELSSNAPAWLVRACAAARDPNVFRLGAAGFVAVAGRSHEHVCRTCRDVIGISPSGFINRVRIEFAADQLARTARPIPEIAEECGIENVGHFYRLFRDHYGTTPRAYRVCQKSDPF